MEITAVLKCYVEPKIGSPVTNEQPGMCGERTKTTVGKIIDCEYVGNYDWRITAEIEESAINIYSGCEGKVSLMVVNPSKFLNEYQDEMEF